MRNYWLEKFDDFYRDYVRNCLTVLCDRIRLLGQIAPTIRTVNIERLIGVVDEYAKIHGMVFKKEYEFEVKMKVICEEWYRLTKDIDD
jgi:hypothetical protein